MDDIVAAILEYLRSRHIALPDGADPAKVDLIAAGLLDSVAVVELVGFVESRYDVFFGVDDFEAPDLPTAAGLARIVSSLSGEGS